MPFQQTSTVSIYTSTTTMVYAACATNNFADNVGGVPIDSPRSLNSSDSIFYGSAVDSAYDCWVATLTDPFLVSNNAQAVFAYRLSDGVCFSAPSLGGQSQADNQYIAYTGTAAPQLVVGNSIYGEYTQSG
jgi:hypothetical protein